jgi:hypothetical protein
MSPLDHIVRENPGALGGAAGAKGIWIGLNNESIQQFTDHAQVF